MPLKITLLLQDGTGLAAGGPGALSHLGGWSESLYRFSDDVAAARQVLFTDGAWGTGLCKARARMLPKSASIVGQRIQRVFPKLGRSSTSKNQWPGTVDYVTDVPQMALNCTIPGIGVVNVRRFTIRAIPDSIVVFGEYQPGFGFDSFVLDYFNSLGNFRFPGQDFAQAEFNIISITNGGVMQLTAGPTWAAGDLIDIRGIKDSTGGFLSVKQTISVLGPGLNQVTLQDWILGATTGGRGRKFVIALFNMDSANASVDRISVRKVGRPFDQYRGRRSKRKVN